MAKVILCPMCKKKASVLAMPFCSSHCADLDLGRWFRGEYAIAVAEVDENLELQDENTPQDA